MAEKLLLSLLLFSRLANLRMKFIILLLFFIFICGFAQKCFGILSFPMLNLPNSISPISKEKTHKSENHHRSNEKAINWSKKMNVSPHTEPRQKFNKELDFISELIEKEGNALSKDGHKTKWNRRVCKDHLHQCAQHKALCANYVFRSAMRKKCAKTCDSCRRTHQRHNRKDSQAMSYVVIGPPPPSRPIIRSTLPDVTPLVSVNNGANFFHPGRQLKPVSSVLSTAAASSSSKTKKLENYSRKMTSAKRFRHLIDHLKWRHAQTLVPKIPPSYVQIEEVSSGLTEKTDNKFTLPRSGGGRCGNALRDTECEMQRDRCADIFFFHIMLEYCAQTCGFCGASRWIRKDGSDNDKGGFEKNSSPTWKQTLPPSEFKTLIANFPSAWHTEQPRFSNIGTFTTLGGTPHRSKPTIHTPSEIVESRKTGNFPQFSSKLPSSQHRMNVELLNLLRMIMEKGGGKAVNNECVDRTSDCSNHAVMCKNRVYRPLMRSVCAATCQLCSTKTPN